MLVQQFSDCGFVRYFFDDLDKYLSARRDGPERIVQLELRDRARLEREVRPGVCVDWYSYKGVRLVWVRA